MTRYRLVHSDTETFRTLEEAKSWAANFKHKYTVTQTPAGETLVTYSFSVPIREPGPHRPSASAS